MSKRRNFSTEFKAKVALDALSGEVTLAELADKYGVYPRRSPVGSVRLRKAWWRHFPGRRRPCRRMLRPKYGDSTPKLAN